MNSVQNCNSYIKVPSSQSHKPIEEKCSCLILSSPEIFVCEL
jgi:hypothetical protein